LTAENIREYLGFVYPGLVLYLYKITFVVLYMNIGEYLAFCNLSLYKHWRELITIIIKD
jgi:hypothetical protein